MILINKNSTNEVVLTLSEKTTLTNVKYLFEVIDDQSNDKYYFVLSDTSPNKERYSLLTIIEGTTVTFVNIGFYKYNIYEQTSPTNLNPTGLNLVENGKLKVVDTSVAINEYSGNQTTYKVYGG